MIESAPLNPYAGERDEAYTPFAGRQSAFSRLRRQLTDPAHSGALLLLGRPQVGKTDFARAFDTAFEETFVGVYLPLRDMLPAQESAWWLALAQAITERLVQRSFTLHRLMDLQPPDDDARVWFADVFLPPVLALIRPLRRLILLLDDAETLVNAVRAGELRADTFAFLRELMDKHAQLHLLLTLDTAHEALLSDLYPLVRPTDTLRLSSLAPDETAWLLREPIREQYTLDDAAVDAAHRLTGGDPAFTQALGAILYRRHQTEGKTTFTDQDLKRASQPLFRQVELELRRMWDALDYQEQQVLRAISQLLYADPLRAVDVDPVAAWLVDSDDPIDATTVGAALRSLEYREIVVLTPEGIRLSSDLMQRFLLENAYNVPLTAPPAAGAAGTAFALARRNRGLRVALLIVLIVTLVVGLLLLAALSSLPREPDLIPTNPTVTLFGGA